MGDPAPPYGPQYGHGYVFPHPPPPDPPELPEPASRWPAWPWWYGPAAMGAALLIVLFLGSLAGAIAIAAGADAEEFSDAKGFVIGGTILQQAIFAAVAVAFAARIQRPRGWHFGLRRVRLGPALGWTVLAFLAYWLVTAVYVSLVQPDEKQETLESLGTDDGTGWLVVAAVMVIVLAPLAEEFFFRGFFYRSLRTRLPVVAAAVLVGAVFGAIHATSTPVELLVPLAFLGVVFCLVYEKTGTLFTVIGLHAFNNTIAFGVQTDEWAVAIAAGAFMLGACLLLPRLLAPRAAPAPA